MSEALKTLIATRFGQHAQEYDSAATVQKQSVANLTQWMHQLTLPPGPILELGVGTGLLSQALAEHFPMRELHFTDLCPIMVETTRQRLQGQTGQHRFYVQDGEAPLTQGPFAAIFSGFTFQWFEALPASLANLHDQLQPGGHLLATFPSHGSYGEWKEAAQALGLPFTANPLPKALELSAFCQAQGWKFQIQEQSHPVAYASPLAFFHHFKALGATTQIAEDRLSYADFKRLLAAMQRPGLTITTQILTLQIQHEA